VPDLEAADIITDQPGEKLFGSMVNNYSVTNIFRWTSVKALSSDGRQYSTLGGESWALTEKNKGETGIVFTTVVSTRCAGGRCV
jgi:hypothetical protein